MIPLRYAVLCVGPTLDRVTMADIRRAMELRHFKWDTQVGDVDVLAPFPLLIRHADWRDLSRLAEQLFAETLALERELIARPSLHARLGLPRALQRLFARGTPSPSAVRVMRFDFHFTAEGWRISEVNSDVPGGFTEATSFTALIAAHTPDTKVPGNPTRAIVEKLHGHVALLNAPGHMEDHQVVAHLAAALRERAVRASIISLPRLRFEDGYAFVGDARVDAIVRFFQAEWFAGSRGDWQPLFVDGKTPVFNPGTASLTESKRLPLLWPELSTPVPTWHALLPETRELADAPWMRDDDWLIKSAYSNTGDTVTLRRAQSLRKMLAARLRPTRWIAQRRFTTMPIVAEGVAYQACVGVYVVDGSAAGAYVRVTPGDIVDFSARDAALLLYDDS